MPAFESHLLPIEEDEKMNSNPTSTEWVDIDKIDTQRSNDRQSLTEMEANDPDNCEPVILNEDILISVRNIDLWDQNVEIITRQTTHNIDLDCDWNSDTTHVSQHETSIFTPIEDKQ
jgi:hypothetical protein